MRSACNPPRPSRRPTRIRVAPMSIPIVAPVPSPIPPLPAGSPLVGGIIRLRPLDRGEGRKELHRRGLRQQLDPPPTTKTDQAGARIARLRPGAPGVQGEGRGVELVIADRLAEQAEIAEEDRVEGRVLPPEAGAPR